MIYKYNPLNHIHLICIVKILKKKKKKKHTYRWQPGASLTHKFIHKSKCLMSRVFFFGYKFAKALNSTTGITQKC